MLGQIDAWLAYYTDYVHACMHYCTLHIHVPCSPTTSTDNVLWLHTRLWSVDFNCSGTVCLISVMLRPLMITLQEISVILASEKQQGLRVFETMWELGDYVRCEGNVNITIHTVTYNVIQYPLLYMFFDVGELIVSNYIAVSINNWLQDILAT